MQLKTRLQHMIWTELNWPEAVDPVTAANQRLAGRYEQYKGSCAPENLVADHLCYVKRR